MFDNFVADIVDTISPIPVMAIAKAIRDAKRRNNPEIQKYLKKQEEDRIHRMYQQAEDVRQKPVNISNDISSFVPKSIIKSASVPQNQNIISKSTNMDNINTSNVPK